MKPIKVRLRIMCLLVYIGVCILAWPLDLWAYFLVIFATYILLHLYISAEERKG